MKKLLIMSIALVAIMATIFTVSAFAANTVTIDSVTLSKYYDTAEVEGVTTRTFNDAYANVTVNYTVTEDTPGSVDRLTFYLAAQDLSSALEGEEAKVVYIDEQVNPGDGSLTFVIEKARIRTALVSATKIDSTLTKDKANAAAEGLKLTFKLGGTDVETADDYEVVYKNPTVYGDVTGDGQLKSRDATLMVNAAAELFDFTDEQTTVADINGDGEFKARDAVMAVNCVAELIEYSTLLGARDFAY